MVVHHDTLLGLNQLLKLNYTGREQDWAMEFADQNRIAEFIDIVNNNPLSDAERYAVVSLIIASYDDYLNGDKVDVNGEIWNNILAIIELGRNLYKDILNYWAVWDTEDVFAITSLIRSIVCDPH
jgi:hypothetical protein